MLYQIIYASTANRDYSETQLLDMLAQFQWRNKRRNITGMLLYHKNNFLQVLEGEHETITDLYKKIEADPRHRHSIIIHEGEIAQREFANWEMGFVNLSLITPEQMPGFSEFLRRPFTPDHFSKEPSYARVFINTFKDVMS